MFLYLLFKRLNFVTMFSSSCCCSLVGWLHYITEHEAAKIKEKTKKKKLKETTTNCKHNNLFIDACMHACILYALLTLSLSLSMFLSEYNNMYALAKCVSLYFNEFRLRV